MSPSTGELGMVRRTIEKAGHASSYRVISHGQRARPTRQSRASQNSCVSSPSNGQGGSSTGSAAVVAFCVSGRCFVVAQRGKRTRLADRLIRSPLTFGGRSKMAGNCRGLRAGVATSHHHKAPSILRAGIGKANGPSSGAAPGQTANQTRRNGTGQLPASDLVGWLKTEAQGCREGTNGSAHTVYPQGGEADTYQPLKAQGKGGCRVKLCTWPAVPFTVERRKNTRKTPRGENFALRAEREAMDEFEKKARAWFRAAVKSAGEARKSGNRFSPPVCVTCPASRHVQIMAEYIGARKPYHMIAEEPEHCAESMLSVVGSLYAARARIAELERGAATEFSLEERNRLSTASQIATSRALHAAAPMVPSEKVTLRMDAKNEKS